MPPEALHKPYRHAKSHVVGRDAIPAFQPSGNDAAPGLVPAPPSEPGASRYLREDGTWALGGQGEPGPQGPAGANGSPGATGPAGPSNVIRESSGPTDLAVGAIADGQVLRRSGSTVIGAWLSLALVSSASLSASDLQAAPGNLVGRPASSASLSASDLEAAPGNLVGRLYSAAGSVA